jgi:hypothetical protein
LRTSLTASHRLERFQHAVVLDLDGPGHEDAIVGAPSM